MTTNAEEVLKADEDRGALFPQPEVTGVRFAPEVPDELADAVLQYEARRQGLGTESWLSRVRR